MGYLGFSYKREASVDKVSTKSNPQKGKMQRDYQGKPSLGQKERAGKVEVHKPSNRDDWNKPGGDGDAGKLWVFQTYLKPSAGQGSSGDFGGDFSAASLRACTRQPHA
jgi:hypothetical protein